MIFRIIFGILIILQGNNCFQFSTTTIAPITTPKTLDLSNQGIKREKFFLHLQHTITNMRSVKTLILRGNKFDKFLDCSTNLDSLEILDLSHNDLSKFFFLCNDEYNLQSLNVSHNRIEYINDQALSHRIMKLKILDVSHNNLQFVNDTMLQHMKNLEFLSLAHNPIGENIDEFVFQDLTNLKHLNLRNISSPYFTQLMFENLIQLEYLDLSENPIEDVPPLPTSLRVLYITGTNIGHISDLIMPQLRVLVFDNSPNLTRVSFNNFENLTKLEILSFDNSRSLSQILLYKYTNANLLPSLKNLSMQNCNLESLNVNTMELIQRTKSVQMQQNPWRCDCKLKWLASMNVTSDLKDDLRCQFPEKHRGKLLHYVPLEELECEEPSIFSQSFGEVFFTFIWIGILLILLGSLGAGIVHYTRGHIGQWLMKIRDGGNGTISYTNVVESNNDLIRILPVGESSTDV